MYTVIVSTTNIADTDLYGSSIMYSVVVVLVVRTHIPTHIPTHIHIHIRICTISDSI